MNLTVNLSNFNDLARAHRMLEVILQHFPWEVSEETGCPVASDPSVIKPEDNPEAGADTQIPIDFQQGLAAAAFGDRSTMAPEQQIAAHAAGTLPVPTIPVAPPAPTLNPVAAVPGGAAAVEAPQPPTPPAAPPEKDKRGFRWDSRIHASTKVLNADGTWRQRRGVDDALVAQVEAEQTQLNALPPAPPVAAAPAATAVPEVVTPPAPPVAAPPVPQAAAPAAPAGMTFPALCEWLNGPMLASPPKLTLDEVKVILSKHGFDSLPMLMSRPDYVPTIHAELQALVATRG